MESVKLWRDQNALMDITGSPTVACRLYCISDVCVLQTPRLTETDGEREAFNREGTRGCRREGEKGEEDC